MNDFSKNKIEQLKENSRFSPDNRILILKVKLKKQLELDGRNISDEGLTRALRSAHNKVGVNQNGECSFDTDPIHCQKFLDELKIQLESNLKLRLRSHYLANKVAEALCFEGRLEMFATLALYQNLIKNKWFFNDKSIKKLPRLNSLKLGMYVSIPSEKGITYKISRLNGKIDCYVLYCKRESLFSATTPYRDWGLTPTELISWTVAKEVVRIGPKTWNSLVLAMSCHENAEKSSYQWNESKNRNKELIKLAKIPVY